MSSFLSWNDVFRCLDYLYVQIEEHTEKHGKFEYIYGIPRGGLIPAVMISHHLNIPLIENLTVEKSLHKILVVDDIIDSGDTILTYSALFQTAALVYKYTTSYVTPNFYGMKMEENRWVVFPWETEDTGQDTVSKTTVSKTTNQSCG